MFFVDGVGGIIMVDGRLDREVKDNYFISVLVKVGIVRLLFVSTLVNIDILDRNDNFLVFKNFSV